MALNTAAKARDEGNWRLEGWSPMIASEAEYDTFVGDMLDRANNYLRYRVGLAWYTANVAVDPLVLHVDRIVGGRFGQRVGDQRGDGVGVDQQRSHGRIEEIDGADATKKPPLFELFKICRALEGALSVHGFLLP